jgi:hypothetical protein
MLACLFAVLVFVACRALAASWYAVDLSGIPDEGPVPTSLLPWFLHEYHLGGDVWSDSVRMRTWSVACAGYVVPAFISTAVPRRAWARVGASVIVLALLIWAMVAIPTPSVPAASRAYFTASTVRSARFWIAGLGILGALAGVLTRVAISARADSSHRG